MSRFVYLVALSVIATTGVIIAASAPTDRLYALTDSCGIDAPAGGPIPSSACFSCRNIPTNQGPTTLTTSAPTIDTAAPTTSPTANLFPIKSIYTHCFLDNDSIYTIYYADSDCQGSLSFDTLNDNTCPDCSGCNASMDCGNSECPFTCCGIEVECARCQNAGECNMLPDECQECPGCSNPNPYCDAYCIDSKACNMYGNICSGCSGCSNPPGSAGRVLDMKEPRKIEFPKFEYFGHKRILGGSSSNFTSNAQAFFIAYDGARSLAIGALYSNPTCSKESFGGTLPIEVNKCQAIPPAADGQTLAIKFTCSFGATIEVTVNGYSSTQDCEIDSLNTTFSTTAPDGSCVPAPSDKWALTIQCAGWGQVPPTPSPPVPGPNDVAFGTRVRYPDRRCLSGTGETIGGSIIPCDTCAAFPNRDYKIYSCADSEVTTYSNPDCSGLSSTNNVENCDGLGPIRGIFSFEKIYRPANGSIAFFSSHVGLKGCWAENVESFIGVESDVCTEIKPAKGSSSGTPSTFVKARCDAHTIDVYMIAGCTGQAIFSIPFTDNSCIALPGDQGFMRASCSGYQTPLPAPPTPAPTNSPTYVPTHAPTYDPTKAPATSNPTRTPIKAPTNSPTAPTAPTTQSPTVSPTKAPSGSPTAPTTPNPTRSPIKAPTNSPTTPTAQPTKSPTSKVSATNSPTSDAITTTHANHIIQTLIAILAMVVAHQ